MGILTQLSIVLTAAAITSSSVVKAPSINQDGTFELLILHNNDMHARFEQTSQFSGICTTADRELGKCYGGFPRVAHVVKEARRAAAAGEGPPVLYLNAGDTYTGTPWFNIYKWQIAAEFINALQPDAVSLGNNELERGSRKQSPFLDNLNTTILATNIILNTEHSKLQKSVVFAKQGVRIGLVAFLTPNAQILDSTGVIEYVDETIALKDEVSNLQAHNVNIIIALGHADVAKNMEIAREVVGIDLVISGHKNTFNWNGTTTDGQLVKEALVVEQKTGKQVPVVQSYTYNKYLGQIYVKFDSSGEILTYNLQTELLDETIPQDSLSVEILNKYSQIFTSRSEEVVGQTAVVLDGDSCKVKECNLGNLVTDAMMYIYALRFEGESWTDAPIAVIPGGHIEASIAPSNRPANITLGNLLTAIPTESTMVAVTMTGDVLLQFLEHSIANYSQNNPTGQFLQFSGIRIIYDMEREAGSRVVSALVRCWSCYVPEYYTIDDWRPYKILMPAALADGEFGYSMLVGLERETVAYDEVTCLAEYIKMRSPVYPDVIGRIVIDNLQESETDSATNLSSNTLIAVIALMTVLMS